MARLIRNPWSWTVLGCAVLAAMLLPPEATRLVDARARYMYGEQRTAIGAAQTTAQNRMGALNDELRVIRLADSLRAYMRTADQVTLSLDPALDVSVGRYSSLDPEDRNREDARLAASAVSMEADLQRNLRREIESLPGDQKMKVGVFAVDQRQGAYPGMGTNNGDGTSDVFLFDGESESCVVVKSVPRGFAWARRHIGLRPWWYSDASLQTNILGACYYYAAYGMPGENVKQWLASGGFGFAKDRATSERSVRSTQTRKQAFGIYLGGEVLLAPGERCLAGSPDLCDDVVLSPRVLKFEREAAGLISHPELRYRFSPFDGFFQSYAGQEDRLLSDIENEFGPERFQEFWTSDQPMETAFASAFGLPIGDWVQGWLSARFEPIRLGPALDLGTLLYSLALIAFCMGAVFATAQRRTV